MRFFGPIEDGAGAIWRHTMNLALVAGSHKQVAVA